MLKKLVIVLMLLAVVGCAPQQAGEITELPAEAITFTRDDLCLYSESEEGVSFPVVWLGMDINEADTLGEYAPCFGENDIAWRPAVTSGGEQTECVKFINYSGGIRKGMQTIKGIYSTGMYFNPDSPSSKGEDIIALYGLDPEKEQIYSDKTDENNYSVTLSFGTDENGEFTRLVSAVDAPLNTADEKVRYMLKFLVVDGYVSNIQMLEK